MLVVVEDRDVHDLPELLLDDEAVGGLDVLEVDAAEGGRQIAHAVDEGVHVRRIHLEVDGIDVGEALEENGLALHHRLGSERAQIAEPQYGGAVGDDGHHVALARVLVDETRVLGDRQHRNRHPRRIGEREVSLRRHRLGRLHLQLAGLALAMELEGLLVREGGLVLLIGHGVVLWWGCRLVEQSFETAGSAATPGRAPLPRYSLRPFGEHAGVISRH